jgi:hypothetical protein
MKSPRLPTGMPLGFAHMTGRARYPPRLNPHYSGRLLLQLPLCRCDKPAHGYPCAGGRARRSVGQHTVSSMPPSLTAPRARLAKHPDGFATNLPEYCGLPGRKAGTDQGTTVVRPWLLEFQKVSTRRSPSVQMLPPSLLVPSRDGGWLSWAVRQRSRRAGKAGNARRGGSI